jgi:outer membrane protein OmpA-like peptidoglycan-associated protein
MRSLALCISLLIALSAASQFKQKMANQFFSRMEYSKCVSMFTELSTKCLDGKKKADWENVRKAAISNYHLFRMKDANFYFDKLQGKNMLTESDRELYIEALRYEEMYGKSNEMIRESASLFPSNTFFSKLNAEKDDFNSLFTDSAFYSLRPAAINSGKGDFGATYFGSSVVFVSKSKNVGFINPKYGWDDDFYLNIMQANLDADSNLTEPKILKHNFVSRAHDGPVNFSPDGTEMAITKNTLGKKHGKQVVVLAIYFSTLENGEWSELTPFEFNNSKYNIGHATYSPDGNTLYFVSDKPGGIGEADIYKSTRLGKGWSEPQNLGKEINTTRNEMFPFVEKDMLYFASDGHYGLGGMDIFQASIDGLSAPHNIGYPVNTSHDDFGLIFDASGKIGYLSSNRGSENVDNIYHVKKRVVKVDLIGNVYAQYKELEAIPNQKVYIKDNVSQLIDSLVTTADGEFSCPLQLNRTYQVYAKKKEFILLGEVKLSTAKINRDSTLRCELILKPTTIKIHLRVIEKVNRKIIPDATTTISDYNLGWDTTLMTNPEGIVTLTVDRNKVFWAHGAKKGFVDADISFNTSNEDGKVIDLELALPPIKRGEKFKLENIFYDLNKSTLREGSVASLDRLADFILKNDLRIELSAHTDSRGSNAYNQKLSQARAQSCVDYLIKKGIKSSNIKAKGYGETKLVNGCSDGVHCTEDEHQENRRTEVEILEVL